MRWRLLTELAASDYRVRGLVTRVDQPQNLISYHLRLLCDGGLVYSTRSSFDGWHSYYLDLDRWADALNDAVAALHRRCANAAPPVPPVPLVGGPEVSPCCSLVFRSFC